MIGRKRHCGHSGSPRHSYVATTSVVIRGLGKGKCQRAFAVRGPAYLQIHAPCERWMGFDSAKTIEIARLAVEQIL